MKKIIFVLISVLSLVSCGDAPIKTESFPLKEILYKGHHYISWYSYGEAGIVHDPDCTCHLDTLMIYVVEDNDTTYVIKNK